MPVIMATRRSAVLALSRLQPDPTRLGEFLACLWQGPVPDSFTMHKWLYLGDEARSMLLLWEGDEAARSYVDQVFGSYGVLSTEAVTDATPGLRACLSRDLDGFGAWLASRGTPPAEVDRQLDVRRRGLHARTPAEAAAAGRAWSEGRDKPADDTGDEDGGKG
jgi:hypothetical protein